MDTVLCCCDCDCDCDCGVVDCNNDFRFGPTYQNVVIAVLQRSTSLKHWSGINNLCKKMNHSIVDVIFMDKFSIEVPWKGFAREEPP